MSFMRTEKSFIAKIAEAILSRTKPNYMDSAESVDVFLKDKLKSKSVRSVFKSIDFNGTRVFIFGNKAARNTILYMHGGAYVNEINYQHFLYCWLMARKLDSHVLAPVYPLAPLHNASEAHDVILELYKKLRHKDNLILMGDSAGGGFVYSFCQYLKTMDLPQPSGTVTFSPWVDVSMASSPYDSKNDPILGEIGLKEMGKSWAGDLDTTDYRVSPLFGDNAGLADTLIFAGESEIFYADIKKYVENLKRDGVNVKFITGCGLFHIYPLFPIPEAADAFKEIKNKITG